MWITVPEHSGLFILRTIVQNFQSYNRIQKSGFTASLQIFILFTIGIFRIQSWHIMVAYAIGQVYGTWVHTQTVKSMGFLEYILVTPSHHRVHHACNIKYLDKNMGMCLIIWDKIFGTFQKEDPNIPVKYGIYPKMPDNRPDTVLFYEWRKIWKDLKQPGLKFTDRINYIFQFSGMET
jgi:sterol desaturase/sphingolipid hydroxylase (fatty acid hydroxylase superfamily)